MSDRGQSTLGVLVLGLLVVAASTGWGYSFVEARRLEREVNVIRQRISDVEAAQHAQNSQAAATQSPLPLALPGSDRGNADLEQEIARLREEFRQQQEFLDTLRAEADGLPENQKIAAKILRLEDDVKRLTNTDSLLSPADRELLRSELEKIQEEREDERTKQWFERVKDRVLSSMTEDLGLSATQQDLIQQMLEDRLDEGLKIREQRSQGVLSEAQADQARNALIVETDQKITAVLTAEQTQKYGDWKQSVPWLFSPGPFRGSFRGPGHGAFGPPPGEAPGAGS